MIHNFFSVFSQRRGLFWSAQVCESTPYSTASLPFQNGIEKFNPRLRAVITQLDALTPRFELAKDEIEIITHPASFYQSLKDKIMSAKSRVFLSTLYIGKTQDDLIACLQTALSQNKELKVHILADALRSTRESPKWCSASLLAKLVDEFGDNRVDVRLYHTPHLRGIEKALIPRRLNEGWGLQHMKLYGFDDEVILSGANLSEDYFTNRQDRYYVFKHKSLTDYYFKIHQTISSISYKVVSASENSSKHFRLTWPASNKSSEPHLNLTRYITDATYLLKPILRPSAGNNPSPTSESKDEVVTVVYPVSQFTPLLNPDISTEKPSLLRLLSSLDLPSIRWTFTAGYFNMHPEIQKRLLSSVSPGTIITASPQSNSFYKSKGISQYLPEAYLYLAKKFLSDVYQRQKQDFIKVREWKNGVVNTPGGWSYHAKGIWITNADESKPSISVIGSSNYTKRAYSSDLESNAIVITRDESLKSSMAAEIENLTLHSTPLDLEDFDNEERHIRKGVMLATKILSNKL